MSRGMHFFDKSSGIRHNRSRRFRRLLVEWAVCVGFVRFPKPKKFSMRACIQRVSEASVTQTDIPEHSDRCNKIGPGFLVLLGVGAEDGERECHWLADKIATLRVFEDDAGKMNLSLADVGGEVLVVSQFTLYGDCRKGRRPSFTTAAPPELADALYEQFVARLQTEHNLPTQKGFFQTEMQVALVNDGPVTLWLDTAVMTSTTR